MNPQLYRFACTALGLSLSLAHAQTASLRQEQIFEGDIAQLTIVHDADIPSLYAIDTSALDQDFIVLDVQPGVSRHHSEEKTFHRMQWVIQMVPRRGGSLQVPPLAFGDNLSEALLLRVNSPPATIRARENVFIETEVSPENPYPGQQTRITTRLLHNLPLRQGRLAEPEAEQATIFRSGKDRKYSVRRGGDSFSVIERSILLTPDSGGRLPVTAASFRGAIESSAGPAERYLYREGGNLSLPVREKPPGFEHGRWLPARQFELALQWDALPDNPRVGDSLGVTLSIEATGLPAGALPADLLVIDSEGFKIYADEAVRDTSVENRFAAEQIVGSLRQRFVIIPQRPGEFATPALSLAWWDVENDVPRNVAIRSRVIRVDSSGISQGTGNATSAGAQSAAPPPRGLLPTFVYRHWHWMAAPLALLLLAGLVSHAARLRARISAKLAPVRERRHCYRELRRACLENDADATRRALIEWGRLRWSGALVSGLHHIEACAGSSELAAELARLDAALFAESTDAWHGERLWTLLAKYRSPPGGEGQYEREWLPGPYPQRS